MNDSPLFEQCKQAVRVQSEESMVVTMFNDASPGNFLEN